MLDSADFQKFSKTVPVLFVKRNTPESKHACARYRVYDYWCEFVVLDKKGGLLGTIDATAAVDGCGGDPKSFGSHVVKTLRAFLARRMSLEELEEAVKNTKAPLETWRDLFERYLEAKRQEPMRLAADDLIGRDGAGRELGAYYRYRSYTARKTPLVWVVPEEIAAGEGYLRSFPAGPHAADTLKAMFELSYPSCYDSSGKAKRFLASLRGEKGGGFEKLLAEADPLAHAMRKRHEDSWKEWSEKKRKDPGNANLDYTVGSCAARLGLAKETIECLAKFKDQQLYRELLAEAEIPRKE